MIHQKRANKMTRLMNSLKLGLMTAVAVGGLALSGTPASAHIACNRFGECWHTSARYDKYPANLGVVFHDDSWRATHTTHRHWRDDPKDDHGYYDHGHWRAF